MGDVGVGRFQVTAEFLAEVLRLPKGIVIEAGHQHADESGLFEFRIRGPGLPTRTPEGADPPYVMWTHERVEAKFEVCNG